MSIHQQSGKALSHLAVRENVLKLKESSVNQ